MKISEKNNELLKNVSENLKAKKKTIAVAESCTGGLIMSRLTDVPGASGYLKGGIVAYSNTIKTDFLGVSQKSISKYGAVSRHVALEMSAKIRQLMKSDIGVSVTGIAGPGGGSLEKPVGLAYISYSEGTKTVCKQLQCKGGRVIVKEKFLSGVLKFIFDNLSD